MPLQDVSQNAVRTPDLIDMMNSMMSQLAEMKSRQDQSDRVVLELANLKELVKCQPSGPTYASSEIEVRNEAGFHRVGDSNENLKMRQNPPQYPGHDGDSIRMYDQDRYMYSAENQYGRPIAEDPRFTEPRVRYGEYQNVGRQIPQDYGYAPGNSDRNVFPEISYVDREGRGSVYFNRNGQRNSYADREGYASGYVGKSYGDREYQAGNQNRFQDNYADREYHLGNQNRCRDSQWRNARPVCLPDDMNVNSNNNNSYRSGEVANAKVRPFQPKECDWYSYKDYFEAMAMQARWSDQTKCTKLMGALPVSLTGITSGIHQPFSYEELIARLDSAQGSANAKEDACLKLSSCTQGSEESISMFAERVRQLVERAYPDKDYSDKAKEEQALRAFLQGLSVKHEMSLTMQMQNFTSLREAAKYGSKLGQIISSRVNGEDIKRAPQFRKCDEVAENQALKDKFKQLRGELIEIKKELRSSDVKVRDYGQNNKSRFENRQGASYQKSERKTPNNSPCHACGQLGHWRPQCPSYQYGPAAPETTNSLNFQRTSLGGEVKVQ